MTHRQLYAEACRKAFAGYRLPEKIGCDRWGNQKPDGWTREEAERLVEYCRQGLRSFEIAPLLGRSAKAIQKAFVRLKFPRLHNICPSSGADNPAWKGGVYIDPRSGYRFRRVPNHPYAERNGYYQEHRLVVEQHLGRFLLPSEVVHHKDGNPANNDIGNLEVFASNGEHLKATLKGIAHNVSPAGRKKLSEIVRARWQNPEMANRMSHPRDIESFREGIRRRWQDPEYRQKTIAAQKKGIRKARLRREGLLP